MLYLEEVGSAEAPRFLGVDSSGRQALSYLDGEVAGRPWPDWVADDVRIASVARLLRTYDDAVQPFGVPAVAAVTTRRYVAAVGGTVDLHRAHGHLPRERRVHQRAAAALIDFDLARPTNDNW